MDKPLYRHVSEVTFRDTDASGWMHFSNIFQHVENAEHAYLRACGLCVFDKDRGGWPRVKVACDYKRPLPCGEKIETQLALVTIGGSSVNWLFEVFNAAGELAAMGAITTVRVDASWQPQPLDATERTQLERGIQPAF